MSIINKITQRQTAPVINTENQLSKEEIEYLLTCLKSTTILGEQVEMFYNLVIKLQNQYVEQTK